MGHADPVHPLPEVTVSCRFPKSILPVELPHDLNFNTKGSPLAEHSSFVNTTCPKCGVAARRDTDTMDTFVDSSWYYFRYCDPKNDKLPFDPGDRRLLDAGRSIHRRHRARCAAPDLHAAVDEDHARSGSDQVRRTGQETADAGNGLSGDISCEEHDWLYPDEVEDGKCKFCGRHAEVGRIEKMSKSKKNTVDPDEMINIHGADTVRLFMLFAAPPEKDLEWSESGAEGASRFLGPRLAHRIQMAPSDRG